MAKILLPITGDDDADELLTQSPLALVLGMLLDQQVPMEWAFKGPATLKDRLGGHLEADYIASLGVDELTELCRIKPAIHRYPGAMAKRIHAVCEHIVTHYNGDAAALWKGVRTGDALYERVRALPGFGDEKTKIFIALLAKRFGNTPTGWEHVAAPFSDNERRSVADVSDPEALVEVRAWKKDMRKHKLSKQDAPPNQTD